MAKQRAQDAWNLSYWGPCGHRRQREKPCATRGCSDGVSHGPYYRVPVYTGRNCWKLEEQDLTRPSFKVNTYERKLLVYHDYIEDTEYRVWLWRLV